jgi:Transferrin
MPVGTLFKQGVLKGVNKDDKVPNDIEAIQAFFGKSCAGSPADVPSPGVDSICTACKGDCSQDTTKEQYTDYPGAFACLKAGDGDVAFTKEGVIPAAEAANYKLVCPDGTTAPLAQYETCNLAVVPSHSAVSAACAQRYCCCTQMLSCCQCITSADMISC